MASASLVACASVDPAADAESVLARNPGLPSASVLFIHGGGDGPVRWSRAVAARRGGLALDWAFESADRLAAPGRGYRLGQALAASLEPVDRIMYAHSAGAWLAQGITDGLAARGLSGRVDLVFLEPFTALSLFQPFAGGRLLGRNADSVAIWWTGADSIPFTQGGVSTAGLATATKTRLDGLPGLTLKGKAVHWAVIDWYFDFH